MRGGATTTSAVMWQMYLHVIKVRFMCMSSHTSGESAGVCFKLLTCC